MAAKIEAKVWQLRSNIFGADEPARLHAKATTAHILFGTTKRTTAAAKTKYGDPSTAWLTKRCEPLSHRMTTWGS
jgi:hypothetical protein